MNVVSPRSRSELDSPERAAMLARKTLNPHLLPRFFRDLIREQYALDTVQWINRVRTGEETMTTVVTDTKKTKNADGSESVELVEFRVDVPYPPAVRMAAAETLIGIAIPKQTNITDPDGETVVGVVALPAVDSEVVEDAEYEIVEEDMLEAQERAGDMAPPPVGDVETVDPRVVRAVRKRRAAKEAK